MSPTSSSSVIDTLFVSEHADHDCLSHLCRWLTEKAQEGMPADKFRKIWDEFLEEEEDHHLVPDGTWIDLFEDIEIYDLPDLYETALNHDVDKFTSFNDNAFMYILAVRGNPTTEEINEAIADDR